MHADRHSEACHALLPCDHFKAAPMHLRGGPREMVGRRGARPWQSVFSIVCGGLAPQDDLPRTRRHLVLSGPIRRQERDLHDKSGQMHPCSKETSSSAPDACGWNSVQGLPRCWQIELRLRIAILVRRVGAGWPAGVSSAVTAFAMTSRTEFPLALPRGREWTGAIRPVRV
jgi:hypothetical protein